MNQIISISLGPASQNYEFETEFLGQVFSIRRFGTDGDFDVAADLLKEWDDRASIFSLSGLRFPDTIGPKWALSRHSESFHQLASQVHTPITMGSMLRQVAFEWSLRHINFEFDRFFYNARVLYLTGLTHFQIARVMAEYTDNQSFADPVIENGIPKFLTSLNDLERYAGGVHEILKWVPTKIFSTSVTPVHQWNRYILRKAMQKANIIVVPYHDFYHYLKDTTVEELGGKTIITATAYDDRVTFLKDRGVDIIIDATPKILERVVGLSVLEGLIMTALGKSPENLDPDDLLEVISEQKMDPRIVYPSGEPRRVNRFAFVIHPLSQEFLKTEKTIDILSQVTPPAFMDTVEKVIAYAPPWVYSRMTGIKSPTGVEAEGWLITIGGTPKQMLSHRPEFTYRRLLQAARMAKRMGAQIMGLGAFTKVVGDAGVTVAKLADIPITTGNSYSASAALWAAADAVRRMGLVKLTRGKRIKGKAMVLGATGAIGSVCCRLLAKACQEVYMKGRNTAKLLALKESILRETPDVKLHISTRADKDIEKMDVIVTATSGAGKKILDITKVKPGCVITDVARPLDLSPEDVAKRPDVLVIESGEILLPGNPEMKDIGLPHQVAYACLAETIVLALEGRFECFTLGREIEWKKVRDIYKMGLKHGMRLAAVSGVNGVFSDADIARVRDLAKKSRKKNSRAR
jgi:predicted amino acid dehydrogenase